MMNFIDDERKTTQEVLDELSQEKNSLRRFLTGITATTLGVLVALHPHSFISQLSGGLYAYSVSANAASVILLICSLYGRVKGLKEEGTNIEKRNMARMQGEEPKEVKSKFPKRFVCYERLGLLLYLSAIVVSCGYIILEVIEQFS